MKNKFIDLYSEINENLDEKLSINIRDLVSAKEKIKRGDKLHKAVTLSPEEVEALHTTLNKGGKSYF